MSWIERRASEGGAAASRLAVVLDIDETILSNISHMRTMDFGYLPAAWNEWVDRGEAPAIEPVREIYRRARQLGCEVIFITGRRERERAGTEKTFEELVRAITRRFSSSRMDRRKRRRNLKPTFAPALSPRVGSLSRTSVTKRAISPAVLPRERLSCRLLSIFRNSERAARRSVDNERSWHRFLLPDLHVEIVEVGDEERVHTGEDLRGVVQGFDCCSRLGAMEENAGNVCRAAAVGHDDSRAALIWAEVPLSQTLRPHRFPSFFRKDPGRAPT